MAKEKKKSKAEEKKAAENTEDSEVLIEDSEEIEEEVEPGSEAEIVESPIEPEEDTVSERKSTEKEITEEKWNPRTEIGKKVKSKQITDVNQLLDQGIIIFEKEIVDFLLPNIKTDLLLIGQSKGKFGGGQRRVFKQTQKKTREGNKPRFATYAVVGNENGVVGLGYGKSKETVPAREKAIRNAKLNIFKIRRGCGSWECSCKEPHSIPFKVEGKCGSTIMSLMPAPKGTGLKVEKECQKILALAGIKDVWSKARGQTKTKTNLVLACEKALKNLMTTKIQHKYKHDLGIVEITNEESQGKEEQTENQNN